jgi:hypothetical protein
MPFCVPGEALGNGKVIRLGPFFIPFSVLFIEQLDCSTFRNNSFHGPRRDEGVNAKGNKKKKSRYDRRHQRPEQVVKVCPVVTGVSSSDADVWFVPLARSSTNCPHPD